MTHVLGLLLSLACAAAPLPLAWWLAARTRGGAAHRVLAALVAWMALQATAVVALGAIGRLELGGLLLVDAGLLVLGLAALRDSASRAAATQLGAALAALRGWSGVERVALIALAGAGAAALAVLTAAPSADYDTWMYQLPQVAEWLQHGRIEARQEQWWWKPTYERGILFYPGAWTALSWSFVAPMRSDQLALMPNLAAWAVLMLAARSLALRLHAPRAHATALAALLGLMPLTAMTLHSAHVDLGQGAVLAAALALGVHALAAGCRASLWLAIAALGLLAGIKMSGLPQLGVAALVAAWCWRRRAPWNGAAPAHAALAAAAVVLTGAWWYVRNALETGNPLGFVAMPALGWEGVIDRAYIRSTSLAAAFDPLALRHWLLVPGAVLAFGGALALSGLAALRGLPQLVRREPVALALLAAAAALAALYVTGPWSGKHAHDPDLSWWLGQQLRYTFAAWALVAVIGAAALPSSGFAAHALPWLIGMAAIAFPFVTGGWPVALAAGIAGAAAAALVLRTGSTAPSTSRLIAAVAITIAALASVEPARWAWLDRRGHGVPRFLASHLTPGDPVAFWGSHQSWLLYGRDMSRRVRHLELETCRDDADAARWLRANGVRWLALGPKWGDFAPDRYRLIEDSALFERVHGTPDVWGMCVYRLRD